MPSRLQLLKSWAGHERSADSDVVARVALDEIEDLQMRITVLQNEAQSLRAELKYYKPKEVG